MVFFYTVVVFFDTDVNVILCWTCLSENILYHAIKFTEFKVLFLVVIDEFYNYDCLKNILGGSMPANLIPPASGQYLGSPNLGGPPPPWNDRAGQLGLVTDQMIRVS